MFGRVVHRMRFMMRSGGRACEQKYYNCVFVRKNTPEARGVCKNIESEFVCNYEYPRGNTVCIYDVTSCALHIMFT